MNVIDFLREPAFAIGEIDENIDLSLPPASGEEYIKRVVIEAQQYADVVVADIEQERLKKPTVDIELLAGCVEAPPCLGPTLEWQRFQVSDFSDVRLYISQLRNEIQTCKRKWRRPEIILPTVHNQAGWISMCTGRESKEEEITPTLNTVLCLNQPTVEQVLEYLVEYVEDKGRIGHRLGQWIYSLLAVLELPLNPDTCSCLRSLARACSIIRANSVTSLVRLDIDTV